MANDNTSHSITVANSLKNSYGKKYAKFCQEAIETLDIILPIARTLLDIPRWIHIHLKPTGKANAYYYHPDRKVVIDPRKCWNIDLLVSALLHELVHAEQCNQGRLQYGAASMMWMGRTVKVSNHMSYEKYRALPWEVEAFGREKELTKKLAAAIAAEYGLDI